MLNLLLAELPSGNPVTFDTVDNIIGVLFNFLIGLAGILMITSIVLSGIMMTMAGSDPAKFKSAQAMLRTAVIGSAVILGTGVILNTIMAVVDRSFFCQLQIIGICLWS
jgi:hypothetical protein